MNGMASVVPSDVSSLLDLELATPNTQFTPGKLEDKFFKSVSPVAINNVKTINKMKQIVQIELYVTWSGMVNLCMAIIACIGTIFCVAAAEVCFQNDTLQYYSPCNSGTILKLVSLLCNCIMTILLIVLYYFKSKVRQAMYEYDSLTDIFLQGGLKYRFAVELIILWLQPYPFTEITWISYEIVVLMFIRVYLLVRVWHDYSSVFRHQSQIMLSIAKEKEREYMESGELTVFDDKYVVDPSDSQDFFAVLKVLYHMDSIKVRF